MKSNVSVLVLLLLGLTSQILAEPLESPLRLKFNGNLLKNIMLKQDQDILGMFSNIQLGDFPLEGDISLNNVTLSFVPQSGDLENFDHHISFDESEFIGFESTELKFVGNGFVKHGETETEGEPE